MRRSIFLVIHYISLPYKLFFNTRTSHSFHNVTLGDHINQYRRDHHYYRHSHSATCTGGTACDDLRRDHGEGFKLLGEDHIRGAYVPYISESEEHKGQPHGLNGRHYDMPEDLPVSCTVDLCGLKQYIGNVALDVLLHKEYTHGRCQVRQYVDPIGVDHMKLGVDEVAGDRKGVGVEHKGHLNTPEEGILSLKSTLRKHESGHRGEDYIKEGGDNAYEQAVCDVSGEGDLQVREQVGQRQIV